ncbi:AAA domain containing protein [Aeromonas phage P5]|nr:AAA domain containing protein [Aeromonas phage P5]
MNALELKKLRAANEVVVPHNVLLYGAAKVGKTLDALKLAQWYKILYLDGEKGGEVMMQLDDALLENIEWVRFKDTRKSPMFIEAMMKFFEGEPIKLCETHGILNCTSCLLKAKDTVKEYKITDYDPKEWIIVTDSLTQLSASASWFITNKQKVAEGEKFTFDEWRLMGFYLERILASIQAGNNNVIMITHEQGIQQEDETEKLTPSGGTKNFARNNAKYFGTVVYYEISGGQHRKYSVTTDKPKAITGSRLNANVQKDGLISLFRDIPSEATDKPAGIKKLQPLSKK